MDFKLNLPTDECTCEAKQFYDKYRKQVDAFIQHELESTTDVVVGRKAPKPVVSKRTSIFSEKAPKKKVHLPKIKGAKHEKTKEDESASVSLSTTTSTKSRLPDIKVTKKWSEELSSSSSSEIKLPIVMKYSDTQKDSKLMEKDSNLMQKESKSMRKDSKSLHKEAVELQLKKNKKAEDFISTLVSKCKKEGLDDDFVADMLTKAKEAGQEQDLLLALSNANDEGTLNTLLFNMLEAMEKGEFEEIAINLVKEGKENRRNRLLSNLLKMFKSDSVDFNYMVNLIAKAREEDPDDELFLILFKAVKENNLQNLLSDLYQAKKKGQYDDMISFLMKKGKREQTKQLLSIANAIAQDYGKDEKFIEELLRNAKKTGQVDELLSTLKKAKLNGNLHELISDLANEGNVDDLINNEAEKKKETEKDFSELRLEDAFDNNFLDNWFARAKTKEQKDTLKKKLSQVMKSGKHSDFNILVQEEKLKNLDDLFSLFNEVISDDESDTAISAIKAKKPKLLTRKSKPIIKREHKQSKQFVRKPKIVVEEDVLEPSSSLLQVRDRDNIHIDKTKKRKLLYQRQFSFGNTLPDVDYDLIERRRLPTLDLSEPEKSDEEEQVYAQKIEKRMSKKYRESFLKRVFAKKKVKPPSFSSISASSSSGSTFSGRKHLKKKKSRTFAVPNEHPHPPTPRKMKKHFVKYAKKKSLRMEKEMSDSDLSTFEELLNKKISKICDTSEEDRSERGYLIGFRYKDDVDFCWKKRTKKSSVSSDSDSEETPRARRRAIVYFETRQIEDLFHFLGSHLVSDKPDNPIDYLVTLLGKCIQFRNGFGKPPLLFEQKHVESLYNSMDIFNEGFVSLDQYRTGMKTLFIKDFKDRPPTNEDNMVLKETFIHEALKMQRIHLKNMIRGTSLFFNPKENSSSKTTLGTIWSKFELYHDG